LTFHGAYGKIYNRRWPAWVNRGNPDDSAPAVEHPKDFLVLAAWGAGTFAVLVLAGALATRVLIGGERAGRPSRVPGTDRGGAPRESVVR